MFSYFDLLVQLADLLKVILGILFAAIDGFNSDVIRLQSQKSEVLRILIYTKAREMFRQITYKLWTTKTCDLDKLLVCYNISFYWLLQQDGFQFIFYAVFIGWQ